MTTYLGVYFLQTTDIDLNCSSEVSWGSIGFVPTSLTGLSNTDYLYYSFRGVYDGGEHVIANIDSSLFGFSSGCIKNIYVDNINCDYGDSYTAPLYWGSLVCASLGTVVNCHVSNVYLRIYRYSAINGYYYGGLVGIIVYNSGVSFSPEIIGCSVSNASINITAQDSSSSKSSMYGGGLVGRIGATTKISGCFSDAELTFESYYGYEYLGGVVGYLYGIGVTIEKTIFSGTLTADSRTNIYSYAGGIVGEIYVNHTTSYGFTPIVFSENYFAGELTASNQGGVFVKNYISVHSNFPNPVLVSNNLFQGKINNGTIFTIATCQYNIVNNDYSSAIGIVIDSNTNFIEDCFYNLDGIPDGITASGSSVGKTAEELKDRDTYSNWADFDTYWIIDENLNNGFPFLRAHIKSAQVTGFDGSGTQADPYQIKTTADLQGMQAYYNEYDLIDEYWWILVNNIDISIDANGLTINWTPIGYEGGVVSGFNGHFDGNGKTISGLTITEQYENVGLFGRLSGNATITNLNVTGTINWDQAKYVGGVVGLLEDGATLTNCSFTGTTTGYLNSGNIAVVGGLAGKYGTDAITGSANYDCYVYGADNYTTFNRFNSTYAIV